MGASLGDSNIGSPREAKRKHSLARIINGAQSGVLNVGSSEEANPQAHNTHNERPRPGGLEAHVFRPGQDVISQKPNNKASIRGKKDLARNRVSTFSAFDTIEGDNKVQHTQLKVRTHKKLPFGSNSFLSVNGDRKPRATTEFQFTSKPRVEVGNLNGQSGSGDPRSASNSGHGLGQRKMEEGVEVHPLVDVDGGEEPMGGVLGRHADGKGEETNGVGNNSSNFSKACDGMELEGRGEAAAAF